MASHAVLSTDVTGGFGTELVTDTAAHTPTTGRTYYRFVALQNTVIASFTAGGMTGNSKTAVVVNSGCTLDAPGMTSLTLTSGSGVLYYML